MAPEPEQSSGDPLARLAESLDSLELDAGDLARDIAAETPEDAASAARLAIADSIVPLSAKDGLDGPGEVYLEGLRRRRLRLQREGAVLAERLAELNAESARLNAARDRLNDRAARIRRNGADALTRLDDVHAYRERTLAWAAATTAERERLLSWSERLARHTRRLRDSAPSRPKGD